MGMVLFSSKGQEECQGSASCWNCEGCMAISREMRLVAAADCATCSCKTYVSSLSEITCTCWTSNSVIAACLTFFFPDGSNITVPVNSSTLIYSINRVGTKEPFDDRVDNDSSSINKEVEVFRIGSFDNNVTAAVMTRGKWHREDFQNSRRLILEAISPRKADVGSAFSQKVL